VTPKPDGTLVDQLAGLAHAEEHTLLGGELDDVRTGPACVGKLPRIFSCTACGPACNSVANTCPAAFGQRGDRRRRRQPVVRIVANIGFVRSMLN
jgi:hypothetical protein